MPPNALINEAEAASILKYVLSLADTNAANRALSGSFNPSLPAGDPGQGSVIVRAVYADQQVEQAPSLSGEAIRILRSPVLGASQAGVKQETESSGKHDLYLVFRNGDAKVGAKLMTLSSVRLGAGPDKLLRVRPRA